jgi:protein gp37
MSKIEWCDATINPIVGCSKISPACHNCYAEGMAKRLQSMGTRGYDGVVTEEGKWSGKLNFVWSELEKPMKWKKPRRIFVGSMTDLFHENVSDEWIDEIMVRVQFEKQHTFIFLTKRTERMKEYFSSREFRGQNCKDGVVQNLWIGTTVENQEQANIRIPILLNTPATKRFVSIEPMLEKIDIWNVDNFIYDGFLKGYVDKEYSLVSGASPNICKLDWVICGGESGRNARSLHPDWVKDLQEQCEISNTPFFFKQWGEFMEENQMTDKLTQMKGQTSSFMSDGSLTFHRCGRKSAGKLLDGKLCQAFPDAKD